LKNTLPHLLPDLSSQSLKPLKEVGVHTVSAFVHTRALNRAASLSFNLMLGLGPIIALAVLIAGHMFTRHDQHIAVTTLNRVIHFIAPQLTEYEKISAQDRASHSGSPMSINPKLTSMIDGFVASTQKSSAGVIEGLSLIVVVLLLINSIEESFNDIWRVKEGRSWLVRIGFFGIIMILGSVIFIAAVALTGASTFITLFFGKAPFGYALAFLAKGFFSLISYLLMVCILALFYRILPNTIVLWKSAFSGAAVASALLILNNFLGFLYVKRVIDTRSLFGSLGIILVLMFGIFVFWLYILIGGQISYAVQKVYFKSKKDPK